MTEALNKNFALIAVTLNAAKHWPAFSSALARQEICREQVLVVDSSSDDGTPELVAADGYRVLNVPRAEFNHGGTRQWAATQASWADILVYCTQDAILARSDSVSLLLRAFDDEAVGCAYGRQLPRPGAGPIEAHARLFNYPAVSSVRTRESSRSFGIKAIFISNSFAAYRRSALDQVGGFPQKVIFGEDTATAGKMLLAGWKIAYVAEAEVYHSHNYRFAEEFRRYFDIGVLHAREPWLQQKFGEAGGEGRRFVQSEIRYLWPRNVLLLPSVLLRTAVKLLGYRLGLREVQLSPALKRRLSMNRRFWAEQ